MTQSASVYGNASIVVRPLVLARAMWPKSEMPGGVGFRPIKGTWYAHASVGTLHVRPVLNMKTDGAQKMRAIAEEVLSKPFQLDALLATVRRLVSGRRQIDSAP